MEAIPPEVQFGGKLIGYYMSGLHNKDSAVAEVHAAVAALSLKIANSENGAEPNFLFVQSGIRITVKVGLLDATAWG